MTPKIELRLGREAWILLMALSVLDEQMKITHIAGMAFIAIDGRFTPRFREKV